MLVPPSPLACTFLRGGEEDDDEAKDRPGKRKLPLECRVEGCGVDLAPLKLQNKADYRVRYKICEEHLKALEVHTEGKVMRFCQQCTSLHDIASFDGQKRSCRERLNSHNARRRKKRQPVEPSEFGKARPPSGDAVGFQALQGLLNANSLATLSGGTANSAVLSKVYEFLAASAAQPGATPAPKLDEPGSTQLLKSAADLLGSMGSTGIQSAVAALQAVQPQPKPASSVPVAALSPHPSPAQPTLPAGMGMEQLNELLGSYSHILNMQAGQLQPQVPPLVPAAPAAQPQDAASLLGSILAGGSMAPAVAPSPPAHSSMGQLSPADGIMIASLANSGLLGQGVTMNGIADIVTALQQVKHKQQQQQQQHPAQQSSPIATVAASQGIPGLSGNIASAMAQLSQLASMPQNN